MKRAATPPRHCGCGRCGGRLLLSGRGQRTRALCLAAILARIFVLGATDVRAQVARELGVPGTSELGAPTGDRLG